MNDALRSGWVRFAAAVWLMAATIATGFAHRPLPGFPSAAEMVDAGGRVFGMVCSLGGTGVDADTGASKSGVCEACLLFTAPGLGAVAEVELARPQIVVLARLVPREETASSRVPPRETARGPPAFV